MPVLIGVMMTMIISPGRHVMIDYSDVDQTNSQERMMLAVVLPLLGRLMEPMRMFPWLVSSTWSSWYFVPCAWKIDL